MIVKEPDGDAIGEYVLWNFTESNTPRILLHKSTNNQAERNLSKREIILILLTDRYEASQIDGKGENIKISEMRSAIAQKSLNSRETYRTPRSTASRTHQ